MINRLLKANTPEFSTAYIDIALAHREALEQVYLKQQEVDWTNISPVANIFEGERTNHFRIGEDKLIVNAAGKSSISMGDFAVAILDEVESKKFPQQRFTVGY